MDAKSLYSAGRLAEAVDAALAHVKTNPIDVDGRFFLAELLCFQGDWDRSEKQLDAVVRQSPDANMLAMLTRQLIRAEILREQVFAEGRSPQLVGELPDSARIQLELCAAIRAGDNAAAEQLAAAAEQQRTAVKNTCDGKECADIRDLDDRIAGVVEVFTTTGKYYWVPWQAVRSLEFSKPSRPMDLIWRKTSIDVEQGPEGEVFIPTRYPFPTAPGWDDGLRLGRATSWAGEEPSPITGLGQRMLLVGDESITILELQRVEVAPVH